MFLLRLVFSPLRIALFFARIVGYSRFGLFVIGVAVGLLDDHLKHCVTDAVRVGGDEADAKIKEATDAIARLVRS